MRAKKKILTNTLYYKGKNKKKTNTNPFAHPVRSQLTMPWFSPIQSVTAGFLATAGPMLGPTSKPSRGTKINCRCIS